MITTLFFSREAFAATRRKAQNTAVEQLIGGVKESILQHKVVDDLTEAMTKVYESAYHDEAEGDPGKIPTGSIEKVADLIEHTTKDSDPKATALAIANLLINEATILAAMRDEDDLFLEWVTMHDGAVRQAHKDTDGQTRPIGEKFDVDGVAMSMPGDVTAPIELWINCRCTLRPTLASEINKGFQSTEDGFRDVSEKERKKRADDGTALPDGSYPIANCQDLRNAIQAIGRAKDPAKAKAHIKKRKSALGCSDVAIPDSWSSKILYDGPSMGHTGNSTFTYTTGTYWPSIYTTTTGVVTMTTDTKKPEPDLSGFEGMDEDQIAAMEMLVPWHGVLAPEGVASGDGRTFAADSLSFRDLPLPLTYQKAQADGHGGSVVVGSIETIERVDGLMLATGWMLSTPEADEVIGLMAHFGKYGVSVDADDAEFDYNDETQALTFTKARICSASLVSIPAFAEAYVALGPWEEDAALVASGEMFKDLAPGKTEDGPGWLTHPVDTDRLRDYWVRGPGAAKIGWGTPGDFNRCRLNLAKYVKPQYLAGYCFTGETEFLTRDGVVTFAETVGTSQMVLTHAEPTKHGRHPVTKGGYWTEAPIESFGEQPVLSVTLRRGKSHKTIRATAAHEWFVSKDAKSNQRNYAKKVATLDLRPGMAMASLMPMPVAKRRSTPSPVGIMAGVVYGDGTRDHLGASVDLWGDKDANLLPYFDPCHRTPIKNGNGVLGQRVRGLPASFKAKPGLDEGFSYLMGWLAGYVAADGTVNQNGAVMLQSADRGSLEFAAVVANRLGISTLPIRGRMRLGTGSAETMLYTLGFVGETFPVTMLLIPAHRINFGEGPAFTATRWVVESVADRGEVEEVFCAVVPETETFALADYLWTHNCANRHYDALGFWPGRPVAGDTETFVPADDATPAPALTLVASAAPIEAPADWFQNPNLTKPTHLTVTKEGRVFGHVAEWGTCHIGMQGVCTEPPKTDGIYPAFANKQVLLDSGEFARTGVITIGGKHAPGAMGLRAASRHYDDTTMAVSDVAIGDDEHGIWVAGWIRPGTIEENVVALRASDISGDWRSVDGWVPASELVGVLAVNNGGFNIKVAASNGNVISLVAAGMIQSTEEDELPEITDRLAEAIVLAMDKRERKARVREKAVASLREKYQTEEA